MPDAWGGDREASAPVPRILPSGNGRRSGAEARFGLEGGVADLRRLVLEGVEFAELGEIDQLEAAVEVSDDGGQALDPVAAVEVVHVAHHAVGGGVDVTAHDADAAAAFGEFGDVLFKIRHMADRALHARLDRLRDGVVFL